MVRWLRPAALAAIMLAAMALDGAVEARSDLSRRSDACLLPAAAADVACLQDLPLEVHPATQRSPILVILISGDGGWRDIDQQLTRQFNDAGVNVVGLNALMYFWQGRSQQKLAHDIERVVTAYRRRWSARTIALVGYSFGADVVPFAWPLLSKGTRRDTRLIALLGLEPTAIFRVTVLDILGIGSSDEVEIHSALRTLPMARVTCFYGSEERVAHDTGCLFPELASATLVERPGAHHFDENYLFITRMLLRRLRGR